MTTAEQLRTLVAEQVMGCELMIAQDEQGYDEEWWVFPADGEACMSEMRLRGQWLPDVTWADAGPVIERMRQLGFHFACDWGPYGDDVSFYRRGDNGALGEAGGEDIKRNISLAALRALGVEVE